MVLHFSGRIYVIVLHFSGRYCLHKCGRFLLHLRHLNAILITKQIHLSIAWADSTWRAVYIIYFILSFQIIPESLAFKIQLYFNLILL